MKILLASNGGFLIKEGYKLLGVPKEEIRIGYVITASKGASNLDYLNRHRQEMTNEGYSYEEYDIEGKSKEEILKFFEDKNVIHMEGGSSFYLLKAIRETGFEEILKILFEKGLTYVGSSAGAYVMCPHIQVSTWGPRIHPNLGLTDLTGLNYVPFSLKVHYTDELKDLVKEKMKTINNPLRILRDEQGILVEDGKFSFKGEGNEVKLG